MIKEHLTYSDIQHRLPETYSIKVSISDVVTQNRSFSVSHFAIVRSKEGLGEEVATGKTTYGLLVNLQANLGKIWYEEHFEPL